MTLLKKANALRGTFATLGSQVGSLVDPWSYQRAKPEERAALDADLEGLRAKTAAFKNAAGAGDAATGNTTAEASPGKGANPAGTETTTTTTQGPGVVETYHGAQVIKHVEKFIAQAEAYKSGAASMDMPIAMVGRNLRDLTEVVAGLDTGLAKSVSLGLGAAASGFAARLRRALKEPA